MSLLNIVGNIVQSPAQMTIVVAILAYVGGRVKHFLYKGKYPQDLIGEDGDNTPHKRKDIINVSAKFTSNPDKYKESH